MQDVNRVDPHTDELNSIIDGLRGDTVASTLKAMEYAEHHFAPILARLHAVCLAMEGFSIMKEFQHIRPLYDVALEMQLTIGEDDTANEIMAIARSIVAGIPGEESSL